MDYFYFNSVENVLGIVLREAPAGNSFSVLKVINLQLAK